MLAREYAVAKSTADLVGNLTKDFANYLMRMLKFDKLPVTSGKICDYLQYANQFNLPKQFIILENVKRLADIEDFKHAKNPNVNYCITSRTFITQPAIIKDLYSEDACIAYIKEQMQRGFSNLQFIQIYNITNGFPLRLALAARYLQDPAENVNMYLSAVEARKPYGKSCDFLTKKY